MRTSIKKDNQYRDVSAVFVKKNNAYKPVDGLFVKESGEYVNAFPIEQQAFHVLKKYGANAHLYLPGVGAINGISAGNYLDSAGTTAASVDQPIGLMLDAMGSALGAELASQDNGTLRNNAAPTFDTLTVATFANSTDKVSVGYDNTVLSVVAGKSYRVSIPFTVTSGLVDFSIRAGGALGTARASSSTYTVGDGSWSFVYVATATEDLTIRVSSSTGSGATSVTINSRSVREIPGIHASQATTATKPILRQVPTKLGPNLVVNGDGIDATGWIGAGGSVSTSGGELVFTATPGSAYPSFYRSVPLSIGRYYQVSAQMRVGTSGDGVGFSTGAGISPAFNAAVNYTTTMQAWSHVGVATAATTYIAPAVSAASASAGTSIFDNIEVREVLEWTYAAQFDGVDDYLSTGIDLANSEYAITVGAKFDNPNLGNAFALSSLGSTNGMVSIGASLGNWVLDQYGNTLSVAGASVGATAVLSGRLNAIGKTLRLNGVTIASDAVATKPTATTDFRVGGGHYGTFFAGRIYPAIVIKGTVSDADLLTLEKFVGSLSGVTL